MVCAALLRFTALGRTLFVSQSGNDAHTGSLLQPVRTIQRAYDLARPGDTIRIFPGVYRETVNLTPKQHTTKKITVKAIRTRKQQVVITGSDPASQLTWLPCDTLICPGIPVTIRANVYVSELKNDRPPTLITETTADGISHTLPLARAPNYRVTNDSKYHEFWWVADADTGTPTTLYDTTDDPGMEPGNLKTLPDVTGARLFVIDGEGYCGAFEYILTALRHNPASGSVITDGPIGANMWGNRHPGVGAYAKYFIENAMGLLDAPGEWYFDPKHQQLFLYPLEKGNPSALPIEFGVREAGIIISTSHIDIQGVTIKNTNDHTYKEKPAGGIVFMPSRQGVAHIRLSDITIDRAGDGIIGEADDGASISDITIKRAVITGSPKSAIKFIGSVNSPDSAHHIVVKNSVIHTIGFPYNEPSLDFIRASDITLTRNHIYDTASYGIHFTGYEKLAPFTKNILVSDNTVERICQNASGCAAIKFFGGKFTNTVARGNVMQDNLGWSYCKEKKEGLKGYALGLFVSNASGVSAIHNQSYRNNGVGFLAYTRQISATDNVFQQNIAADSEVGIGLEGGFGESDVNLDANAIRHDNSVISDNILRNNTVGLLLDPAHPEKVRVTNNEYINNHIALSYNFYQVATPSAISEIFPFWEQHGK